MAVAVGTAVVPQHGVHHAAWLCSLPRTPGCCSGCTMVRSAAWVYQKKTENKTVGTNAPPGLGARSIDEGRRRRVLAAAAQPRSACLSVRLCAIAAQHAAQGLVFRSCAIVHSAEQPRY
eukprot:scaffold5248_cov123-Isochrysis_galbana.AAC.3